MPTTTKPPPESPRTDLHVPPVLSLFQETPNAASPRIHILGDDLNSKYIAHAMSKMHEHVELMSLGKKYNMKTRSRNVETYAETQEGRSPGQERLVEHNGAKLGQASDSNAHIDQLVLTGPARHAVPALEKVRHRIDHTSTICLMNDGLGVLEDVRKRIFAGRREEEPNIIMGHMSHKIAYNRKHDSIREMRQGQTVITPAYGRAFAHEGAVDSLKQSAVADEAFVRSMETVEALHSSWAGYHDWLRFKMPEIILGAVVEPTCVMFDSTYHSLLKNEAAFMIMHTLLEEILAVLDTMPEVASSGVGDFIRTPSKRTRVIRNIVYGRKNQASATLKMLQRGGYTDVNYLNGYFIARGKALGIDLPRNTMTRDIVAGWHQRKKEDRDQWIDTEEKPLHIDQRSRWKPFGRETRWTTPRGTP